VEVESKMVTASVWGKRENAKGETMNKRIEI
jgi:hypothetical protein